MSKTFGRPEVEDMKQRLPASTRHRNQLSELLLLAVHSRLREFANGRFVALQLDNPCFD
ncbi:hypothetical protein [Paraburkholderia strydomiana]|uniref:Uncharacterized protein n=1 Tax=Paraburkholderia strydomiana TaxID=1245417 RepID=A0ABW9C9S1_9BURK